MHPTLLARSIAVLVAAAATLAAAARPAEACSCLRPPPPEQAFYDYEAVFVGRVLSLTPNQVDAAVASSADPVAVELEVERTFKGVETPRITVRTAQSSASCGFPFQQDGRYLIYATPQDDVLSVSLCSPSSPLDQAQDQIEALERIAPGHVPGGSNPSEPVPSPGSTTEPPPATPGQVEPGARGCGGCSAGGMPALPLVLTPLVLLLRRRR